LVCLTLKSADLLVWLGGQSLRLEQPCFLLELIQSGHRLTSQTRSLGSQQRGRVSTLRSEMVAMGPTISANAVIPPIDFDRVTKYHSYVRLPQCAHATLSAVALLAQERIINASEKHACALTKEASQA
jgi:hypothetical protein